MKVTIISLAIASLVLSAGQPLASPRADTARQVFGTAAGSTIRAVPPASVKRLQPVRPNVSTRLVIDHSNRQAIRNVTRVPPSWKLANPKKGGQAGMTRRPVNPKEEVGVQFVHPTKSNRHVRVMPGKANDRDVYKRQAYVRAHGDGGFRDVNGNTLNKTEFKQAGKLDEFNHRTHIPLTQFDFAKMKLD